MTRRDSDSLRGLNQSDLVRPAGINTNSCRNVVQVQCISKRIFGPIPVQIHLILIWIRLSFWQNEHTLLLNSLSRVESNLREAQFSDTFCRWKIPNLCLRRRFWMKIQYNPWSHWLHKRLTGISGYAKRSSLRIRMYRIIL